jgi:glutamate synthase domain-containing protein 2
MSYGALSNRAVVSLNSGAKKGNFFHNTGEGGISHYHLEGGGDSLRRLVQVISDVVMITDILILNYLLRSLLIRM